MLVYLFINVVVSLSLSLNIVFFVLKSFSRQFSMILALLIRIPRFHVFVSTPCCYHTHTHTHTLSLSLSLSQLSKVFREDTDESGVWHTVSWAVSATQPTHALPSMIKSFSATCMSLQKLPLDVFFLQVLLVVVVLLLVVVVLPVLRAVLNRL